MVEGQVKPMTSALCPARFFLRMLFSIIAHPSLGVRIAAAERSGQRDSVPGGGANAELARDVAREASTRPQLDTEESARSDQMFTARRTVSTSASAGRRLPSLAHVSR